MIEVVLIVGLLALAIATFAIAEDLKLKGFKWNAKDGDKDGKVQEGTRWERKARKKK
jgi:hypothetical protein